MNNKIKYALYAASVAALPALSFAGESSGSSDAGFDPSTIISSATTSVGTIAAGIGALLAAAILIYVGFLGYRKVREGLNKA